MYSAIIDGEVLDFHYKKMKNNGYNFYLGKNIHIGQIFKINKMNWSAVPFESDNSVHKKNFVVHGFRSRYHASEYLLKIREI